MEMRKYNHVERLTSPDVEGLLDGTITYSPKLDGTNASVRWDNDTNSIAAYSRTRRLSLENDNADFCLWATKSDCEEAQLLRNFCFMNPNLIVYGEWLGLNKFVGHFKDYNPGTLGTLWVFDVYDVDKGCYLGEAEWRKALNIAHGGNTWEDEPFPWYVPYFTMENPTLEKIDEAAKNNTFLLDNANHPGEGIVIRRADFRNKYGHYEIGKYVLAEYTQGKSKSKKVTVAGDTEKEIVQFCVTDAELAKTKAKVILACNVDEFDNRNGKMIGMMLNMTFNDAILDEMKTICKKWKMPTIDFKALQNLCNQKTRKFLGLC